MAPSWLTPVRSGREPSSWSLGRLLGLMDAFSRGSLEDASVSLSLRSKIPVLDATEMVMGRGGEVGGSAEMAVLSPMAVRWVATELLPKHNPG